MKTIITGDWVEAMTEKRSNYISILSLIFGLFALTSFGVAILSSIKWTVYLGWPCLFIQFWCLIGLWLFGKDKNLQTPTGQGK